jgi:hypothetical protein
MDIKLIEDRIASYNPKSKNDEINAFKEIAQEIALFGLSRGNLFKYAAFQGGTCLRIVYGLPRFSEDLDFILFTPNQNFAWQPFFNELKLEFEAFGLHLIAIDRSRADNIVKRAFLKEDSFSQILKLSYTRSKSDIQSIKIKLEIDTSPPSGSIFEAKIIDFPTPFSIVAQDLSSLFAGKLHYLLCRKFIKGRDWYDFIWYVIRKTQVNFIFLTHAIFQLGPYSGVNLKIGKVWLIDNLKKIIADIDWKVAAEDVAPFITSQEQSSLQLWSKDFFMRYVDMLDQYIEDEAVN